MFACVPVDAGPVRGTCTAATASRAVDVLSSPPNISIPLAADGGTEVLMSSWIEVFMSDGLDVGFSGGIDLSPGLYLRSQCDAPQTYGALSASPARAYVASFNRVKSSRYRTDRFGCNFSFSAIVAVLTGVDSSRVTAARQSATPERYR